jgi:hypothetical protein
MPSGTRRCHAAACTPAGPEARRDLRAAGYTGLRFTDVVIEQQPNAVFAALYAVMNGMPT